MYMRRMLAMSVALVFPFIAAAQEAPPTAPVWNAPDFRLVVLGYFDAGTLDEFHRRVSRYDDMRRAIERTIVPLSVTENPDEITGFERALTARIRESRGSSARGQIFLPRMATQLKTLFLARVDADTLQAIMDDGPGEFDVDVNEAYAKHRSLATMPPNILQLLPDLADDMEYRFVGRHLILRDVRANMVVDEIPFALVCEPCVIRAREDGDR